MVTAEGVYPKVGNDPTYASEINRYAGFGDGSDGAFSESSETTNLTQGTIYQYTSFLLDTSATLSASSTSGKPTIILVQGDVTINGTIDLKGKGFAAGNGVDDFIQNNVDYGLGSSGGANSSPASWGGRKGGKIFNFQLNQSGPIMNGTGGYRGSNGEAGGGGGASSSNNGTAGAISSSTAGDHGVGGEGGCTLLIICGGDLTFGDSSSIDVSGNDGGNGTAAGGGGGGAGDVLIFYNGSQTDNGLTTDVTGGSGGIDTTDGNANGGDGGDGQIKIVDYDTIFW